MKGYVCLFLLITEFIISVSKWSDGTDAPKD
jgi:hypothetical protein